MLKSILLLSAAILACDTPKIQPLPAIPPLPPNSFAFGVFGDGPYQPGEELRYHRVLDEVSRADVAWLIHVGDFEWFPCSDSMYSARLDQFNSVSHPVIYIPGDNEWTDCHSRKAGGYDPLDRLARIRKVFFATPGQSLGRERIQVESQSVNPRFGEFVENARWTRGGFIFATLHIVGSNNGLENFAGRTPASDAEAARRIEAAVLWMDETFARARQTSAKGVVLALHGEMDIEATGVPRLGYDRILAALERNVRTFPGQVLLIHGDSHIERVGHPLKDSRGRVYATFTRLETFGSPDIGWVRVVVDTVAGRFTSFEPRLMQ